jgi:hypothetical protein
MQGVMLPLYRVEEEGEEARKAVGGGARRGRRRSSPGHHRRSRLEATCTVWDTDWTGSKRGTVRSSPAAR